MKYLSLIALITFSCLSQAKEYKLAVITSEFDDNVAEFFLLTDAQNLIKSIRYKVTLPNGGVEEDTTLPAELVLEEGAVIEERDGFEAVRLELEEFSLKTGGIVKLDYLFNGITGTRSFKKLKLKFDQSMFVLTDLQGNLVNKLFLKANRTRLFGIVGIREIQASAEVSFVLQ